jgi:hypothetical protein
MRRPSCIFFKLAALKARTMRRRPSRHSVDWSLLFWCFTLLASATHSTTVHDVDFKSLSYDWDAAETWPDHLEWLKISGSQVELRNGKWRDGERGAPAISGLTLESVDYGDLTGDGKDEALVVLRYDTGGTQFYYYVYIFTVQNEQVQLIGYFRSGDRSAAGLYAASIQSSDLIVELYDPEGRVRRLLLNVDKSNPL